jgi:prepilin-type processing-associated H-X9-DG protein
MLVGMMISTPMVVYGQQAAAAEAGHSAKLELGYVPPDAALGAVAQPRRVLTAPEMEMLPIEVIAAAGKKHLGFDPAEVEQVVVVALAPVLGMPPQAGVAIRFAKPIGQEGVLPVLAEVTVPAELDGKPYRRGANPMVPSIFQPDARTLLVAHDELLRKMLANHAKPSPGPVSRLLGKMEGPPDVAVALYFDPIRDLVSMALRQEPLPPPLAGVEKIPALVSSVEAQATFVGESAMSLTVRARDEAAAKELEATIDRLIAEARRAIDAEIAKEAARTDDPIEQATSQYSRRLAERMLMAVRPQRTGDALTLASRGQGQAQVATMGVLVALLLPAVQAAREAARRAQSANNLKQIGLGLLNYEATHRRLPARANFDKEGKPLLSWRVHVLPFVEELPLYKQFHLDEPWDSPHNRQLIAKMPAIYRNPSSTAKPGMTDYLGVSGEGLFFDGSRSRRMEDLTRGAANTILVVEVDPDQAVVWTKPDDWQFDPKRPLAGLGKAHPGGFQVLYADGSVRFISVSIDPKVFSAMLTIAAGEGASP